MVEKSYPFVFPLKPNGNNEWRCKRWPLVGQGSASKFSNWKDDDFKSAFRAVPNCTVRYSAFIAPDVVLMPFSEFGAYVGEGSMIDTWATVGSCAQIGKTVTSLVVPVSAGFF